MASDFDNLQKLENARTGHFTGNRWKLYCSPSSSSELYDVTPDSLWEVSEMKLFPRDF